VPDGAARTAGIAYGERVAQDLIDLRAHDGRYAPVQYTRAPAPGVWRPTPPALAPMAVPWLGGVTPLLARGVAQFAPPAPPALTSRRYTRDFAEVKALGSATSSTRTAAQTEVALFFSGNAAVQINTALRDQAAVRGLDIVDAARMFAAVDMTALDALIVAWQTKLDRAFWRPITAIQLADTDGNPATAADPGWMPLLVTPPHPDYTSGHTCFTAASMSALAFFFGRDDIPFSAYSTASGTTRYFRGFSQAIAEVIEARIWGGIHTRTADVQGAKIGLQVTLYMLGHYFRARH